MSDSSLSSLSSLFDFKAKIIYHFASAMPPINEESELRSAQ